MFGSESLNVNKFNRLEIGGCDSIEIAKQYGTPVYIMDEDLIRKNCNEYKNAIDTYYEGNGLILYASKAFCCVKMCKIVNEEGLGIDVVSGGELFTALKSGFPTDKIYFHGNNKTKEELIMALKNNVGRIVVDSEDELDLLNELAKEMRKKANVLFRIKPGIDAHTHEFIRTGQIDSKFGVALGNGKAFNIIKKASKLSNIEVVGLHCHIGSQIFELEPFELAAKVMMEFIAKLKDELDIEIKELNLGGGFGIKYTTEDDPICYNSYIKSVSKVIKQIAIQKNIILPKILMEPGRSIVGPAGITVYKVGTVKNIPGIRKYIAVDGGMTDNPRYILYQSKYDAVLANNPCAERVEEVTIAGKCCESGDLIAKNIMMPNINVGDYLALIATGAYNYSMASNYNRIPRPPVVMVSNGKPELIVKRESYEDLIKNDLL